MCTPNAHTINKYAIPPNAPNEHLEGLRIYPNAHLHSWIWIFLFFKSNCSPNSPNEHLESLQMRIAHLEGFAHPTQTPSTMHSYSKKIKYEKHIRIKHLQICIPTQVFSTYALYTFKRALQKSLVYIQKSPAKEPCIHSKEPCKRALYTFKRALQKSPVCTQESPAKEPGIQVSSIDLNQVCSTQKIQNKTFLCVIPIKNFRITYLQICIRKFDGFEIKYVRLWIN